MKTRKFQAMVILVLLVGMLAGGLWPVAARGPGAAGEMERDAGRPVLLRLKYATFDPVADEPLLPAELRLDAYPADGEGAYIVQFEGPVQEAWKEQIRSLGGRVMDYVPDYAFLVWMDGATRSRVADLGAVRWVGVYQPAYKLSPHLDRTRPVYRVILSEGSDLKAVEARLGALDTPTKSVPSEQFTLVLPDGDVEAVAAWPEVLWIENRPFHRLVNNVASGIMNAPAAWSSGRTGSGMLVTVADSGVDSGVDNTGSTGDMHPDFDNRVTHISSWPVIDHICWNNPGDNDGAADLDTGHGTHVLGSVGGNGAASGGQIKGLAYQATLSFQALEQWTSIHPLCGGGSGYELSGIPEDIGELFQEAYNWGSRVHSNSWGSDAKGEYTADSQAVDQFVWDHPQMIILFAAGNEGVDANRDGYVDEGSMGSPSTAKNCITSGASENERSSGGYNPGGPCSTWGTCWPSDYPVNPTKDDGLSTSREELAAFSSRGPTDDGRIKPDVVAPGTNIVSTRSGEISGHGWGPYPNSDYMYMGGTSMANPLIAGAATLVREYYVEGQSHTPSAALVKATLINSAADIAGYGAPGQEAAQPIPNNHEGWGRVDVGAATSGSRKYRDGETVSTGANKTYHYQVGSSAQPFKATLAWGDYPGSLPSGGLVNDLHLVVTAPGGTVYRGNHLNNGWSTSGGSADGVNNVESVYIQNPAPGEWTVRVEGANVPHGPQPFALVVTGQFGPPPVYDNWLYLPLAVKDYGSGASPGGEIVNGDFEDGPTGWTEYSSHSWDLIMDSGFPSGVTPHGGSWAVWLGGGNNEVAYVEQQVTVPTSKPYLHYWHWIDSAEFSCGYDFARVRVNGTPVEVYDLCMSENTGGWEEHVVDLSAYGGQSVSLQLRAETDALFSSSLFIDDVSFQASGR